eukprot:CAMPEP_0177713412 /NCGR_PEP_ID=MMETSP0484_2-20121128/12923_1 /TAXON_ID=354590 /ORGANISM="Rhodomonas lens, Strain RHODO" /LENGTH=286 /DNA_ID=CAMNT_0019225295 /DNA_START=270 /DNA_END=1127 /DNA_ORIENTATION=+
MKAGFALILVLSWLAACCGNRFQEAWVMNCEHTFPDGTHFDLGPLTRTAGRPDYVGRDKSGNNYYINVCNNVQEIPHECRVLQKDIRAPVYQVRNDSFCHWLGLEGSHRWDLIEPGSPFVGVQLTYMDGEYCQEGVNRQVRLQMYCDHMGRLGSVADYYVTVEAPCTYVVTFPTIHGCPKDLRWSWGSWFDVLFFLGVGLYLGVGIAFNMNKYQMPLGVEAIPHIEFWRQLPDLVKDGVAFSVDFVLVTLGGESRRPAAASSGRGYDNGPRGEAAEARGGIKTDGP